ncbi:MAG: PilC/PilY family type IV pilus protein [Gammaproteobacteria bacterium]
MTLLLLLASSIAAEAQEPLEPFWSIAPLVLTDDDLASSDVGVFQPLLQVSDWSGDLVRWRLGAAADLSGREWSARAVMAAREAADAGQWKKRRILLLDEAGRQVPFQWDRLSAEQQLLLDSNSLGSPGPHASPVLNYLRGDRSGETGNRFRRRSSLLGDIMHSVPVHVGAPGQDFDRPPLGLESYAGFRAAHAERPGRLYAGANDGMLHAFDAVTGEEVFAYVPSMIDYAKLATLADPGYRHAAFVDGTLAAGDVQSDGGWKTLLSGGLGAGGKGLFLLDVTQAGAERILAEFGPGDPDLGHISGPPSFAMLEDGEWYLVAGNGTGSTNARGVLCLVSLASAEAMRRIQRIIIPGSLSAGLAAPALVDTDANGRVDTAYAGDRQGNLWKFDLARRRVEQQPLFAAGRSRPITLQPEASEHPDGGHMVYIATGGGRSRQDLDDRSTQAVYALHDAPDRQGTIPASGLDDSGRIREFLAHGKRLRSVERNGASTASQGWVVELPRPGERVLEPPLLHAGRLNFISTFANTADSDAMPGNWFMELDWLTGGNPDTPAGDYSGDGLLDEKDGVMQQGRLDYPAGEFLDNALFSAIRVARLASGMSAVLFNAMHIASTGEMGRSPVDLDADTPGSGLGGASEHHSHGYTGIAPASAAIDYLAPKAGQRHLFPAGDAIGGDFMIMLANADLSPAAELVIGAGEHEKSWRLPDFQAIMQKKLLAYDGSLDPAGHFIDDDGFPLLFSGGASGQPNRLSRLEIRFDPRAVSLGGLHATLPRCVNRDPGITHGRWRNGALTLQLHAADILSKPEAWLVQQPGDLASAAGGVGGVRGDPANDSAFLYESAIYWHYPGKACYGDADWGREVAAATGMLSEAVIFALLDDSGDFTAANLAAIDAAVALISSLRCAQGRGFDCVHAEAYAEADEVLRELLDSEALGEAAKANGGILQGPLSEAPLPDRAPDSLRILKPKSPPQPAGVNRRRAWIDLEQ